MAATPLHPSRAFLASPCISQQLVVCDVTLIRQQARTRGGTQSALLKLTAKWPRTTGRRVERETGGEHFRDDLFSRLSTITIRLPPLRERPEDLPKLTDHLLVRLTARYRCGDVSIAPEVRKAFARYWWPGNIRELESILERGVALSRGQTITIADLPERLFARPRNVAAGEISLPPLSLDALERQQIERAIGECATLEEAASRLGIAATTLWRKRKRYGLG